MNLFVDLQLIDVDGLAAARADALLGYPVELEAHRVAAGVCVSHSRFSHRPNIAAREYKAFAVFHPHCSNDWEPNPTQMNSTEKYIYFARLYIYARETGGGKQDVLNRTGGGLR